MIYLIHIRIKRLHKGRRYLPKDDKFTDDVLETGMNIFNECARSGPILLALLKAYVAKLRDIKNNFNFSRFKY